MTNDDTKPDARGASTDRGRMLSEAFDLAILLHQKGADTLGDAIRADQPSSAVIAALVALSGLQTAQAALQRVCVLREDVRATVESMQHVLRTNLRAFVDLIDRALLRFETGDGGSDLRSLRQRATLITSEPHLRGSEESGDGTR